MLGTTIIKDVGMANFKKKKIEEASLHSASLHENTRPQPTDVHHLGTLSSELCLVSLWHLSQPALFRLRFHANVSTLCIPYNSGGGLNLIKFAHPCKVRGFVT